MTLTSQLIPFLRKLALLSLTIFGFSFTTLSQIAPNSKMTFNPQVVNLRPGDRIQITATLVGPDGRPTGPVDNTRFVWQLADPAHSAYVQIVPANHILTVVALNPPASVPKPASIPVLASYKINNEAALFGAVSINLTATQVTTKWNVLPTNICKQSFGSSVGNDYYCIEVTITNNSGYDLQVSDVSFDLGKELMPKEGTSAKNLDNSIPTTGYRYVRNTIRHRNTWDPRALVLNSIRGLGPVLTGFTPFFHNVNHRGTFTESINILSNPLEKGIEKVWPDSTGRHVDQLDEIALREGTIVANGAQLKARVFFPKKGIKFANGKDKNNPMHVREVLGQLRLEGRTITYLDSVKISTP